jgi:adenylate cyclase
MTKPDTKKIPLNDRILALSKQAGQIRSEIQIARNSLSPNVFESLTKLESSLFNLSQQTSEFEEERVKLLALTDTTQAVNSTLELNDVLRIVMDTIVRLTKAERGFLMLRDPQGEMVTHIARNWEQESINTSEFAISRTIVERVIESGAAILTTNAQEDPRFGNQESIVAYNLRSILCVPLKVKSEMIGVLYADNRIRSGLFGKSDRELLGAFANQAALAIENARLFASIRATLAEVTELKNLMDNIFSSIVSGVITADIEDQVTLCNQAAESILGIASADIVGHQLSDLMTSFGGDFQSHFNDVIKNNRQVTDLEFTHNIPERGLVNWRLNLSPLKDADQTTQGIAIVLDDLTERKHLEAQRRLLERMVSQAVLDQINLDSLQIGGKHADITILFADIRGFTSFSEKQSPEELVVVLNQYLAAAAEAVLAEEGTVDKFLGDAVMAWFNAPLPQPDHTLRAVKAALRLRTAVRALHAKLPPEGQLSFGVGIHYGDVVLGLIGTENRVEYTAIGDSVNTSKRIQENAAKDQILISQEAYDKVKEQIEVRPYGPMQVKGRSEAVEVYEVIGLKT